MPRIAVLIPCWNEALTIEKVVTDFRTVLPEADIYVYDNGNITNLTKNSGFRNEDPKWSPDGKSIVFKRGHWEQDVNDFIWNLALLHMETVEITMLSNDSAEEAMPYFSEDGKKPLIWKK